MHDAGVHARECIVHIKCVRLFERMAGEVERWLGKIKLKTSKSYVLLHCQRAK